MTKETIKIINQKRRCKKYQTLEQRLCKTLYEFLVNECHFTPGTQVGGSVSDGSYHEANRVDFQGWGNSDHASVIFFGKDYDIKFSYNQVILSKRNQYRHKWNVASLNKVTFHTDESVKEMNPELVLKKMASFKDNTRAKRFYERYIDLFGCNE